MLYYEEKIEYNEFLLDIEIFYTFNSEGAPIQSYYTFFVLKDNKIVEDYPEDIAPHVHNLVNDIFINKPHKLLPYA